MNDKIKKNEELLLKKIDELKDCIWGLDQDIYEGFYDYSSQNGYQYNEKKADVLIQSILNQCNRKKKMFYEIMPVFLDISLRFLFIACNTDDWIYSSLIKLSDTVTDGGSNRVSTWDILMEDEKENLNRVFGETINEKSQYLSKVIASEDLSEFPEYVKNSVKKHITESKLNCIGNGDLINGVLHKIEAMQNEVYWDYRFNIEARGHRR